MYAERLFNETRLHLQIKKIDGNRSLLLDADAADKLLNRIEMAETIEEARELIEEHRNERILASGTREEIQQWLSQLPSKGYTLALLDKGPKNLIYERSGN